MEDTTPCLAGSAKQTPLLTTRKKITEGCRSRISSPDDESGPVPIPSTVASPPPTRTPLVWDGVRPRGGWAD